MVVVCCIVVNVEMGCRVVVDILQFAMVNGLRFVKAVPFEQVPLLV